MLALCSVPANAMGAFLSAMDEVFEGVCQGIELVNWSSVRRMWIECA